MDTTTNNYLYDNNGTVEYRASVSNDQKAQWVVEDFNGHQRLRNRATGDYLNVNSGSVYCVPMITGLTSAESLVVKEHCATAHFKRKFYEKRVDIRK